MSDFQGNIDNSNWTSYITSNGDEFDASMSEDGKIGPQGPRGEQGPEGPQGPEGTPGTPGADGKDGKDGKDGTDGFSPVATVSKVGDTATISITDKNGTTTATVTDGTDGKDGKDGKDGTDGTNGTNGKSIEYNWSGTQLGIRQEGEADYTYVDLKGDTGAAGQDGTNGTNGVGISDISKTGTAGLVDTYTITYTDSNTDTFDVTNGQNGTNGTNGQDGDDGVDALTYSQVMSEVHVDSTITLFLTYFNRTPVVDDTFVALQTSGSFISNMKITSVSSTTCVAKCLSRSSIKGATGSTGPTGNGIASIAKTGTAGLVDTYTITYTNGNTDTFTVTNGQDGASTWGSITGTLSDQTDLQTVLNGLVTLATDQTISGEKTFSKPVTINSDSTYGLSVMSASKNGYFRVQRGTGGSAVTMAIKAGSNGGTFGTVSNHQFQFRTNDTTRMTVGTDGSVVLSTDVASASDNNQVATTKWTNSKLANKQDILATTLTADIYLVDGTAPTLADGIYYTGSYKIYVNGTEATAFRNSIFTLSYDGESYYSFTKIYGAGYQVAGITCDTENSNEYTYGYTNNVNQTDITTTMPPNVSSAIWDKRVPSTKLFKTQLDLKANSSSLGSLATMSSIDYTTNYITNKPTIPSGALASMNSIDYTTSYLTNKPTIPSTAADVNAMPASSVVTAFWTGTQAQYEALSPDYSSTTLYLIHE